MCVLNIQWAYWLNYVCLIYELTHASPSAINSRMSVITNQLRYENLGFHSTVARITVCPVSLKIFVIKVVITWVSIIQSVKEFSMVTFLFILEQNLSYFCPRYRIAKKQKLLTCFVFHLSVVRSEFNNVGWRKLHNQELHNLNWSENLKGTNYFGKLCINVRITLTLILRKRRFLGSGNPLWTLT